VPPEIPIYGYIYDLTTGSLVEVPEAARIGKAKVENKDAIALPSGVGGR